MFEKLCTKPVPEKLNPFRRFPAGKIRLDRGRFLVPRRRTLDLRRFSLMAQMAHNRFERFSRIDNIIHNQDTQRIAYIAMPPNVYPIATLLRIVRFNPKQLDVPDIQPIRQQLRSHEPAPRKCNEGIGRIIPDSKKHLPHIVFECGIVIIKHGAIIAVSKPPFTRPLIRCTAKKVGVMILRIFVPLLYAALFTACLGPGTPEPPAWVAEPPEFNATNVFGVSVADTPDAAYSTAVGGIAATLFKIAEPVVDERFAGSGEAPALKAALRNRLARLDYTRVTRHSQQPMDEQTALMVTMSRTDIAEQFTAWESALHTRLQSMREHAVTLPAYARVSLLGRAHETLPDYKAVLLMGEIVAGNSHTAGWELAERVEDAYSRIKFGLKVAIISDAEAIVFVNPLKQALRAEGLNPIGAPPQGTILLNADSQQSRGDGVVRLTMRLGIMPKANGQACGKMTLFLKGSGPDLDAARRSCAEALSRTLKKTGLFHTVGCDE